MPTTSLVLLEVANLTPALIVADRCAKAAGVTIVGVENTMGAEQCLKLSGPVDHVRIAADEAIDVARAMGSDARMSVLSGPTPATRRLARRPPVHVPLLGIDDSLVPDSVAADSQISEEDAMKSSDALGMIETQGLVAALHATDEMLKASAVELVGKEKIGAAYVTIMVRGDVAAVQAAIAAGRKTVEQLGGTLILADVIPRPHPELAALLPG